MSVSDRCGRATGRRPMSSTTEARTFKGQRGMPTGRRPARSRTKAPSKRERECADERGEKRQQGAGPRVPGRKQDRRTDLVSKATGRRPTRYRKKTSSFSQARGHPYTTLDQNSADDETIITSNDNLQKRLQNGEAQGRPQRRCTTCSSQRTIAAVRSKKEHDRRGRSTRRSQTVSEHTWTEYRPTRYTTRGTTTKLRTGRQCGRWRPSMNVMKRDNRVQTHETQDGSKIVARTS